METSGKKIRFFRKRNGLTLKRLGELLGFSSETAEVRIYQYESGLRTPRPTVLEKISGILDVSTGALTVPSMENANSIMHILFALEDEVGLEIYNDHGTIALRFKEPKKKLEQELSRLLLDWSAMYFMTEQGRLERCDYDAWRYQLGHRG